MKKLFMIFIFAFLPLVLFAAPFGLKMGMTIDEIKDICDGIRPQYYKRDIWFITPAKKHPLFETYGVFVDEKFGLYKLRVVTEEIETGSDGAELKKWFENARKIIAKKYGEPDVYDINTNEEIDNAFFDNLRNGKIVPMAKWSKGNYLKEVNLERIELKIISDDRGYSSYRNIGAVVLNYYFTNAKSVEDEQDYVF
ncbi:hypothetical protein [Treponema sp.]|uniref:hypothetical protein n=1 Tax=Treponema sp. TaxID=166 RepID=UPI0025F1F754|nr:hypothetical protein [Treponema sp.]MBR4322245.1 hypothetical protein [Treponema sp.]